MKKNCVILNYHSVLHHSHEGEADPIYSIYRRDFIEHLKIIQNSGLRVVTIPQLLNPDQENSVALTFDDGFTSDYEIVYPLLKEFNFTASFFPTMKNVPEQSSRWHEYREISRQGNYIGAHGFTHQYFSDMDYRQQLFELRESTRIVSQNIGQNPRVFALPGGKYNKHTLEIADSLKIQGLLTTNFGLFNLDEQPFLLNRCTIHRNYSVTKLKQLLNFDSNLIRRENRISKIKKVGQKMLGSTLSDKLNYLLKS